MRWCFHCNNSASGCGHCNFGADRFKSGQSDHRSTPPSQRERPPTFDQSTSPARSGSSIGWLLAILVVVFFVLEVASREDKSDNSPPEASSQPIEYPAQQAPGSSVTSFSNGLAPMYAEPSALDPEQLGFSVREDDYFPIVASVRPRSPAAEANVIWIDSAEVLHSEEGGLREGDQIAGIFTETAYKNGAGGVIAVGGTDAFIKSLRRIARSGWTQSEAIMFPIRRADQNMEVWMRAVPVTPVMGESDSADPTSLVEISSPVSDKMVHNGMFLLYCHALLNVWAENDMQGRKNDWAALSRDLFDRAADHFESVGFIPWSGSRETPDTTNIKAELLPNAYRSLRDTQLKPDDLMIFSAACSAWESIGNGDTNLFLQMAGVDRYKGIEPRNPAGPAVERQYDLLQWIARVGPSAEAIEAQRKTLRETDIRAALNAWAARGYPGTQ